MPIKHVTVSTSTGVFPSEKGISLGEAYLFVSYSGASTANKGYAGTVQGAVGAAANWVDLLTLTTSNSTGQVNSVFSSTGADVVLFDRLRLNLSKNNSTQDTGVWLAAR